MKNVKKKENGRREVGRENKRWTDRNTRRYKSRVRMERERPYARLLGEPKSKFVSLQKKKRKRERKKAVHLVEI